MDAPGLDENAKMTDCYFEKKDWRACAAEVSFWQFDIGINCASCIFVRNKSCQVARIVRADAVVSQMEAFKQCWKRHGNDERTATKDA